MDPAKYYSSVLKNTDKVKGKKDKTASPGAGSFNNTTRLGTGAVLHGSGVSAVAMGQDENPVES